MSFDASEYTWPAFQGRRPYESQKTTAMFALSHKRLFILNEMGTGKTLAVLWACDMLLLAKKIRRVLIVCPISTMRSVWGNEISMNLVHRRYAIAHGTRSVRMAALKSQAEFVIINHDGIKILEEEIVHEQFDVIVIDELTAFKNGNDRTSSMIRVAERARAVWGLTGEITPNSPTEAFYPCKVVNPKNEFLPKYFSQFRDACMTKVNDFMFVPKPIAPQIVAMCTQPAIRFTRAQCLDLPETTYQVMTPALSEEQRRTYDRMKNDSLLEYSDNSISAVNAAVKLNKLLQISAGAVKDDDGDIVEIGCPDRLEMLVDVYEQTPQKKLVVFATFRATIAMLHRELTKRGISTEFINGDVPFKTRDQHIRRFQDGDLSVLVLQPQSTAHGITLTASSTIVWFSLVPSNELFMQGNARIVRGGQIRHTFIYMFVSTLAEKHISNILINKGDMSREVLRLFSDQLL